MDGWVIAAIVIGSVVVVLLQQLVLHVLEERQMQQATREALRKLGLE